MKEGHITKKLNDWRNLKAWGLNLEENKFFQKDMDYPSDYKSCVSAALSLLTNITFKTIDKFHPKETWSTSMIIKFLKSKGYIVIELSKGGILSHRDDHYGGEPLSKYHCLLINANADAEENSLYIMHENKVYHHFHQAAENDPLFFFNKPTQDVLLVYHKKWAENTPKFNPYYKYA